MSSVFLMSYTSHELYFSCAYLKRFGVVSFSLFFLIISCFSMKHQISSMAPSGMTLNEASLSMPLNKWRRVLLKVSGEALAGDGLQNIDPKVSV